LIYFIFLKGFSMKKALVLMLLLVAAAPLYAAQGELATFGIALSAGLAIAIAALGGAFGQGMAVKSALEGIARNPNAADKVFTPMIIGLALIESLVIYALVIAFILQGKI
jgi:F-type H+-transporting ATPase subunit c